MPKHSEPHRTNSHFSTWLSLFFTTLTSTTALCQQAIQTNIITDGTLGPSATLIGGRVTIPAELGEIQGNNLFHSFDRFDIGTDARATFTGPDTLNNVISRVTGAQISQIDGTLASTVGNADVWLINPSGIAFGSNARLDVPASLHIGTAHQIYLTDDSVFSAADPDSSQLTIATPEAFGFLGGDTGDVVVRTGGVLELREGQALSLVGGDVIVEPGVDLSGFTDSTVVLPGGSLQLIATQDAGRFALTESLSAARRGEPESGNIIINGEIDTRSYNGDSGSVAISAGSVQIADNGRIFTLSDSGTGGAVAISAGSVQITDNGNIDTGGINMGGSVSISAGSVQITDNGRINTDSFDGTSGAVAISAGSVQIADNGRIFTSGYNGDGGSVSVVTDSFRFLDRAVIDATGLGSPDGIDGAVLVRTETLTANRFDYRAQIEGEVTFDVGTVAFDGIGNSLIQTDGTIGDIQALSGVDLIIGAELGLVQGSNLFHSFEQFTIGSGTRVTFAGPESIEHVISRVTGGDQTLIEGTLASSITDSDFWFINPSGVVFGAGARLDVPGSFHVGTAHEVQLVDGSVFSAGAPENSLASLTATPEAFGFLGGDTGDVVVRTGGVLELREGQALSLVGGDVIVEPGVDLSGFTDSTVVLPGGSLQLIATQDAGRFALTESLSAARRGEPESGNIIINGEIDTRSYNGDSGSVAISAGSVQIADNGRIFTLSDSGTGGAVAISAGSVQITDNGNIDTGGINMGGSVSISAGSVQITDNGSIYTYSGDTGGAVAISAGSVQIADNGRIFTSGYNGDGGSVSVVTDSFRFLDRAVIDATGLGSPDGIDGAVLVRTETLTANRFDYRAQIEGEVTFDVGTVAFDGIGNSLIQTDGTIGDIQALSGVDLIIGAELGLVQGSNLFHSFEQFTIGSGTRVTFAGPESIEHVISRVTGGDQTLIEGTLASSITDSDFWFINPSGVVFGAGARLDVPGSFHVGTAHEVQLVDGSVFSAGAPENSLASLTATPEAFGFLGGDTGDVVVRTGGVLELREGQALSLVGGDVIVEPGVDLSGFTDSTVVLPGGSLQLIATQDAGRFALTESLSAARRGEPESGNIIINGEIDTRSYNGDSGSVAISAGSVQIADNGRIFTLSDSGTGGAVAISAGSVQITDNGNIDTGNFFGRRSGAVSISADSITLENNAFISTDSSSANRGGDISLQATGPLSILDGSSVTASGEGEGSGGRGGRISLRAQDIQIQDSIVAANGASRAAGRIELLANRIVIIDNADIATSGDLPAAGASFITLNAPLIQLINSSSVRSLADNPVIQDGVVQTGVANIDGIITVIDDDSFVAASTSTTIQGLESELGSGLELSEAVPVAVDPLPPPCIGGSNRTMSSFIKNPNGVEPAPADALSSAVVLARQTKAC